MTCFVAPSSVGRKNPATPLATKTETVSGVTRTTTYTWDSRGNLLGVAMPGKTIEYIVDPLGRRIGKKVDGTLVKTLSPPRPQPVSPVGFPCGSQATGHSGQRRDGLSASTEQAP
ncbi:MAG: hypothetical protein HYV09_02430 [Deltaproteobacteria bacterium]|nr:hypothetical protein [Deltaproteobacteria bacterium]